ncbi:TPA: hypothetical protein ACH3X3_011763 [Trebouxia sp. C0006]
MVSDSISTCFMSQQLELLNDPPTLPSWDFSDDLLLGLDPYGDTSTSLEDTPSPGVGTPAEQPFSAEQAGPSTAVAQLERASKPPRGVRKQSQNRQAQHRFRQRQKARTENLQAQLAAATTQLQDLQARQQQLEARNASLESFASTALSHDPLGPPVADADWSSLTSSVAGDDQQRITLTVLPNQVLVKTIPDVSRMPFTEFASLYAAYAQKMNQCLVQISQTGSAIPTMAALHKWTSEVTSMKVAFALGNVHSSIAYFSFRLDGRIGASRVQLPASFYQNLLAALRLTDAQQADMLHLRKLFYAKIGGVRRERAGLWPKVPVEVAGTAADATVKTIATSSLAQQLQESSAAEFRATVQFGSAFDRGVLTLTQQALYAVNSFPYIPDTMRLFEALAAISNAAPVGVLTQAVGDDFEHSIAWQEVVNYLRNITQANVHLHVPLIEPSSRTL